MSLLKRVRSPEVPEPPPGSFSQCLVAGDTIFISGQVARTEDGRIDGEGSMLAQATIVLGKVKALVEAAGGTMADIAKMTVFVTDISKRAEIGEARRKFFTGDFPCSTLVQVSSLVEPGLMIEIEAIAIHPG
jgi:2-iminobutanoate/2-iminopropanoate deaminase